MRHWQLAMASPRLIFFFSPIFLLLFAIPIVHPEKLTSICSDRGNYTTKSTYEENLNHLLSSLSSNTEFDYGFYNLSNGQNPDTVNAIALCRGDVKPDSCHSCLSNATKELPDDCPNQKEAAIWYDDCMLRYSNRSIYGNMEFGPYFWMYNLNNVSNASQFTKVLTTLLDSLKSRAASGGSLRKFATGNATTPNSQTIYALVQCTPDLSKVECADCLTQAANLLPDCCSGRQGGRVVVPSCNFRYEKDIFYDPAADTTLPPSPSPQPADVLPPPPSPSPQPADVLPPPPASESLPSSPVTPASPPPESANAPTPIGKKSNASRVVVVFLAAILVICI